MYMFQGIECLNQKLMKIYFNSIKIHSGLEIREYWLRDPSRWSCGTLYPQKLALTSPRSGCRSVGIVRSRTQDTDIFLYKFAHHKCHHVKH
jgi:hypothetical protein